MKNETCGTCAICKIAGLLVILGALNWGLIAVLRVDLFAKYLSHIPHATRVVYALIGIAGLMKLINCFGMQCPACKK